jgi:hypothetical protein
MTGVTDQGLEEAAVLRKTLRALRTSEAFDALLARVADGIASVLGAAYCGIYLPNRAGDGFLEKAFAGDMPPEAAAALRRALDPKEDPIVAGVLASRSTITANSDHGQWVLAGRTWV